MPIITLEVMPDSSVADTVPYDSFYPDTQPNNSIDEDIKPPNEMDYLMNKTEESTGMHFLVDKTEPPESEPNKEQEINSSNLNVRSDLLEYTIRTDGSIICNLCGKILSSRSHWYRHKYRMHVMHPVNPAPLFQCEQCLVYFKSRKGYIGHISSRHSETLQDASPVLTNAQAEALARENEAKNQSNQTNGEPAKKARRLSEVKPVKKEVKKEPDPELSIPKTIVPTCQNVNQKQTVSRSTETTRKTRSISKENANDKDSEEKRSREEKLVADIIARVRRECEAQGSGGSARRGYSRKSALPT